MAKEYKVGEKYYLPVTVKDSIGTNYKYPIALEFVDCEGYDTTDTICIADEPDLLLTAEDIAMVINTERDDALEELKSRNAELEALLKEVMATRDEAIRQNDELIAENKKLKDGADKLKDTLVDRTKDVQHLTEENAKLKTDFDQRNKDFWAMKKDRDELDSIGGKLRAENENLTAWYKEANKTASEAAEANDDIKAKIAKLRNRVGEQSAQIQDLNAEIHFLKAERDKFAKTAKDKADLANKACDERNDVQGDLETAKAAIDYLQEENKKLKQEIKDAEATYNVVADTSIKRKNRVTTMEEVIVALVEKIRRLEGDD